MKRQIGSGLAVFALLMTANAVTAYAESTLVDIPFAFVASDKQMPPGRYEVREGDGVVAPLVLQPLTGQKPVLIEPVTRLAVPEVPPVHPRVVFDRVGDKYFLSEVWMFGQDGYLVASTKERHEHRAIVGERGRKQTTNP